MVKRSVIGLLGGVLMGVTVGAQTAPVSSNVPPSSKRFPASWYPVDTGEVYPMHIVTGLPYSGTITMRVRYSDPATGAIKEIVQSNLQARDSAGRTRTELKMEEPDPSGGPAVEARQVAVDDPVSHCNFAWMEPRVAPIKAIATVTCRPRMLQYVEQNIWARVIDQKATEDHSLPNQTGRSDPLGERSQDHMREVGARTTRRVTDPRTGSASELVMETWYSLDLQEVVAFDNVSSTPTPDAPSFNLTDIHRGEPDPDWFYPPAGYRIESSLASRERP